MAGWAKQMPAAKTSNQIPGRSMRLLMFIYPLHQRRLRLFAGPLMRTLRILYTYDNKLPAAATVHISGHRENIIQPPRFQMHAAAQITLGKAAPKGPVEPA